LLEKEIKILDVDKDEIVSKLEYLWAVKHFEWFIHDVYYDFPNKKTNKMELNNRLFRVRKKWEINLYTIKRKRKSKWIKIADEQEMNITNIESFSEVLEKYGMEKIREKKKYRISYSINWLEFDIDKYEWIPTLLEIEAGKKKHIMKYIKILWLSNHTQQKFWSRGLYKHYGLNYNYFK